MTVTEVEINGENDGKSAEFYLEPDGQGFMGIFHVPLEQGGYGDF